MADPCGKPVDPRVLRTRQLLQQALETLLATRAFEELSVQDITEAATVNRATFYAHYPDKFALLECLVAGRFHGLLSRRGVTFNGTCGHALRAIVIGVCDFLAERMGLEDESPRRIAPPMETAIIQVVRTMLLHGLSQHPAQAAAASPAMVASTVSWAIYGGAREWSQTARRSSSEEAADTVLALILPILQPALAVAGTPREPAVF